MIFDGKPTRQITADDIRRLLDEHVPEDRHLDYKQATYPSTDAGTKELLKDVTAFANTDGGYIIIGISEGGEGRPTAFVNVENAEVVRRSIIDRCMEKIAPRLEFDVGTIEVDGSNVVIVHVPESDRKPHCSRPDAEHHYFWRRYEDGNKLMTIAEIRECLEGDRVERQLAELQRELSSMRREATVTRELSLEGKDVDVLTLNTKEAFLKHAEDRFLNEIAKRPCYRLTACPDKINHLSLNEHISAVRSLVADPPALRSHGGWDLKPIGDVRVTGNGIIAGDESYHHLSVYRNGYVEFRTPADDDSFHWAQTGEPKPINPFAIIEPTVCLTLLAVRICSLVGYTGQVLFGLGLYNANGSVLLPYAPNAHGYRMAAHRIGQVFGGKILRDDNLRVPDVTASVHELPGTVPWRLVSEVYYRFGFGDEHVPFFDDQHKCTIGATQ
jgi:hypothetical protein